MAASRAPRWRRREGVEAHRAACRRRARETRPEVQARRQGAAEELSGGRQKRCAEPDERRELSIHCCAMSRQRADLVKLVRRARRRAARWLAPEYEQELRETRRQLRTARGRLRKARAELGATREHSPLFEGDMPEPVAGVVAAVRDERLTYLKAEMLEDLAACVLQIERDGIDGLVIEAGAARGGSAIVLAAAKSPGAADEGLRRVRHHPAADGAGRRRRPSPLRDDHGRRGQGAGRRDVLRVPRRSLPRGGGRLRSPWRRRRRAQRRARARAVRGHDPARRAGRLRPPRRGLVRVDDDVPDPHRAAARQPAGGSCSTTTTSGPAAGGRSTSTSPAARATGSSTVRSSTSSVSDRRHAGPGARRRRGEGPAPPPPVRAPRRRRRLRPPLPPRRTRARRRRRAGRWSSSSSAAARWTTP